MPMFSVPIQDGTVHAGSEGFAVTVVGRVASAASAASSVALVLSKTVA